MGTHSQQTVGTHSQQTVGIHRQQTVGTHSQQTVGIHRQQIVGMAGTITDGKQLELRGQSQPTNREWSINYSRQHVGITEPITCKLFLN